MATTSPDNIRTPDPGDPFNLVPDLATLANDVQDALNTRGNAFKGSSSERVAFTSTAVEGMLWQDTNGVKMIWRKDDSDWVPAVWRWGGTTAQMNGFNAPNGFSWYNTTNSSEYLRLGGVWRGGTGDLLGSLDVPGSITQATYWVQGGWVQIYMLTSGMSIPEGATTIFTTSLTWITPSTNSFGTAHFGGSFPGTCFMRADGSIAVTQRTGAARSNPQITVTFPLRP